MFYAGSAQGAREFRCAWPEPQLTKTRKPQEAASELDEPDAEGKGESERGLAFGVGLLW